MAGSQLSDLVKMQKREILALLENTDHMHYILLIQYPLMKSQSSQQSQKDQKFELKALYATSKQDKII